MDDDVTQAMSKGGGACECPRVGVFFKFWEGGWRHAGNVQGGGACGYLCKISGKSTPLPPLTKAFPYAYATSCRPPSCGPTSRSVHNQDHFRPNHCIQKMQFVLVLLLGLGLRMWQEPIKRTDAPGSVASLFAWFAFPYSQTPVSPRNTDLPGTPL